MKTGLILFSSLLVGACGPSVMPGSDDTSGDDGNLPCEERE